MPQDSFESPSASNRQVWLVDRIGNFLQLNRLVAFGEILPLLPPRDSGRARTLTVFVETC